MLEKFKEWWNENSVKILLAYHAVWILFYSPILMWLTDSWLRGGQLAYTLVSGGYFLFILVVLPLGLQVAAAASLLSRKGLAISILSLIANALIITLGIFLIVALLNLQLPTGCYRDSSCPPSETKTLSFEQEMLNASPIIVPLLLFFAIGVAATKSSYGKVKMFF